MADRPILFSAPMVRALDDRKTQTRRIIKPQPDDLLEGKIPRQLRITIGDRLWVRETWRAHGWHGDCVEIAYAAQRGLVGWTEQHLQIPYPNGNRNAFKYYAPKGPDYWRPSLFMPRWASRISLIVTDVRVERLNDCSETDALAEGIAKCGRFYGLPEADWDFASTVSAVDAYAGLWESINGPGSWEADPWIVAYTFTVHRQNIDALSKEAA